MKIDYSRLPEHMQGPMRRYIENGIPPGSFLRAVLSNDLRAAFQRADDINGPRIRDFVVFLYNEAPRGCYGSPSAVNEWKGLPNA